jgi:hypothetical protein
LSFGEGGGARLLRRVCRVAESGLISESRVVRMSLLSWEDLRSKVMWSGLRGLAASSLRSRSCGDSRRAYLILRIPWKDIDKFINPKSPPHNKIAFSSSYNLPTPRNEKQVTHHFPPSIRNAPPASSHLRAAIS